jgi:hypothetical protein
MTAPAIPARVSEFIERLNAARDQGDPNDAPTYDAAIEMALALLDDPAAHPSYGPLVRFVGDSLPWRDDVLDAFARLQATMRAERRRHTPLERLAIEPMASGEDCLVLTERLPWEGFPAYAETVARVLHAEIPDRADTPVERVWSLTLRGRRYSLAYDDHTGVSIESRDPVCREEIRKMQRLLCAWRDG